jgi:hypothetical protein
MVSEVNEQGKPITPERFIAVTRARLIARYRMHSIPGRPEELETNGELNGRKRVISIAYAGGEMRIRMHDGPTNRIWAHTRDFRLRDGWLSDVYHYLDTFLGYVSPANVQIHPRSGITINMTELGD